MFQPKFTADAVRGELWTPNKFVPPLSSGIGSDHRILYNHRLFVSKKTSEFRGRFTQASSSMVHLPSPIPPWTVRILPSIRQASGSHSKASDAWRMSFLRKPHVLRKVCFVYPGWSPTKKVRWNHCEAQAMNKNGLRNFWTSSEKRMPRKSRTYHNTSRKINPNHHERWALVVKVYQFVAFGSVTSLGWRMPTSCNGKLGWKTKALLGRLVDARLPFERC